MALKAEYFTAEPEPDDPRFGVCAIRVISIVYGSEKYARRHCLGRFKYPNISIDDPFGKAARILESVARGTY